MIRSDSTAHPTLPRGLENAGSVLKAQQALVRSCQAGCHDPDQAEVLGALLAALTDIRRRHRVLQRLWGTLPNGAASPPGLVSESAHLIAEWRALTEQLERCRDQALASTTQGRTILWRRLRAIAEQHG